MCAEWEQQSAVIVVMPNPDTDWGENYKEALSPFVKIVNAISYAQSVIVVCQEREVIKDLFCQTTHMSFIELPYNDTWVRDFGPISIEEQGEKKLLDFTFDGWGGKFDAEKDNAVSKLLHRNHFFTPKPIETVDFVLEGGSIESDGAGTILTTTHCLLNPNRNGGLSKKEAEKRLEEYLGAKRVLWLEHGYLSGDDTDSHIDMLARLVSEDTIVYIRCEDSQDEHFEALQAMERELQSFRTPSGTPYNLIPLPFCQAKYNEEGERLPASYANFLITNKMVLLPTYEDSSDKSAVEILKSLFRDREVIPIPCLKLIEQGGSLHCSTMQVIK
jgi:agmatine deiminase